MAAATVPAWMLETQQLESAIEVKRVEKYGTGAKQTKVTAWIGGMPAALAEDEAALHKLLAAFGSKRQRPASSQRLTNPGVWRPFTTWTRWSG